MVTGPFLSSFATGSFGKILTVRWLGKGERFCMASYKSRSGKRHPIQDYNANVFKNQANAIKKSFDYGHYDFNYYGLTGYF